MSTRFHFIVSMLTNSQTYCFTVPYLFLVEPLINFILLVISGLVPCSSFQPDHNIFLINTFSFSFFFFFLFLLIQPIYDLLFFTSSLSQFIIIFYYFYSKLTYNSSNIWETTWTLKEVDERKEKIWAKTSKILLLSVLWWDENHRINVLEYFCSFLSRRRRKKIHWHKFAGSD